MRNWKNSKNREITVITYLFVAIFVALIGYFVYFEAVKSEVFINSSYNKRQDLFAKTVVRGEILDRNGKVLAETVTDANGKETRKYPYGRTFAHVVGYATNGKSGIESAMNFRLLTSHAFVFERIGNEFKGEKNIGDNVVTTLDLNLQQTAYDALGSHNGAVIVLEPSTGKILAMVSKPDYDPNTIAEKWEEITSADNTGSVLVNRATQGLYPPGSTFKIFTTLEYIRENADYTNYRFTCDGEFKKDDTVIHCYNNDVHGEEDLLSSFSNSCNSSYANLGLMLDPDKFTKTCESLLFNQKLPYMYGYKQSSFSLKKRASTHDVMETSIGQGETLVTPLHMALVTSAIANDGVLMKPYLIDHTENYEGNVVKEYSSSEYGTLLTKEEAETMQNFMKTVVQEGTGRKLKGQSYTAAGKTGSAEYSDADDSSHAWFVGYAHRDDKTDIALAVVVEGAGAGSTYAVPAAKQIFDAYYSN